MWKRSGYCCHCGDCCRGNPFTGEVEGYCPLFDLHSKDGHCKGYGKHPYYLSGCNIWPTHPDQIADKPRCTYRFEQVSDGGVNSIS